MFRTAKENHVLLMEAFAYQHSPYIREIRKLVEEYENGSRAHIDCGMVLETERNSSLDRFQIHGSKGSIASVDFGFNAPGTLSYRLRTFGGKDELRSAEVPNNYCLEVEQMGRCIAGTEKPHVTEEFSIALAETVDRVLEGIGY